MTVAQVKSWMRFWGWSMDGGPGAVKRNYDGEIIARHGDTVWNFDVDDAVRRDRNEKVRLQTRAEP